MTPAHIYMNTAAAMLVAASALNGHRFTAAVIAALCAVANLSFATSLVWSAEWN